MPEISPPSLMVLVQVMDAEVKRISAACDAVSDDDPELPSLEEQLLVVSNVREEVRLAYAAASAGADNLPSLASLIDDD